jgi:hypothetical protein
MLALSAVLAALSLAFTGTASAQTAFQASIKGTNTLPSGGCSSGAFYCGTANIAGYGTASWDWHITSITIVQTSCGTIYTATVDFRLSSDGSTLVLNESGNACVPGNAGAGFFAEGAKAYGHPNYPNGTWTVDTADSTGQFAGLSGSGTDALHGAGAHVDGSYSGTLG